MKYLLIIMLALMGCDGRRDAYAKEAKAVKVQQNQYAKAQPIPAFNWSLERHLLIQLYKVRNQKVATHSVWRSDTGHDKYNKRYIRRVDLC